MIPTAIEDANSYLNVITLLKASWPRSVLYNKCLLFIHIGDVDTKKETSMFKSKSQDTRFSNGEDCVFSQMQLSIKPELEKRFFFLAAKLKSQNFLPNLSKIS